MRLLMMALVAVAASAQVQANFYDHPGVTIGPYVMYAVQVCNASDGPTEIQGGMVWEQAKSRGPFMPQLTSVVLQEKEAGTKTSKRAWALRILSWGSAGMAGLTGSKLIGNLSLDTDIGKLVMAAAPSISLVLGMAAEAVAKVPEKDVDARVDAVLPGLVKLGAHDCSPFYIMWGIPRQP